MVSLQPTLITLLNSLPPSPFEQKALNELVEKTLNESKNNSSPENRKSQWEYLLKNEVFKLAATEGKALKDEETTYYGQLRDQLDLVLTFTEHEACEQTFPFVVLQDLLETQTIASCSHIFSWIESRAARLTEAMVPQKGKALVLLRTLNDLLRRLSKMGSTTTFCGRILTFLSGVFPLGERSGVNLRGEYGPTWEGVKVHKKPPTEEEDVKMESPVPSEEPKAVEPEDTKMQVDEEAGKKLVVAPAVTQPEEKEDFYNTFWSLQLPFSKPPLFATQINFNEFKESVIKVLPVIKEATAKDRLMRGIKTTAATGTLKRKREPEVVEESGVTEYFFAKFLTSPDLLDLEIADTHFRRQVLFQLLILLNHLLTFTQPAKEAWSSSRNRSLQMDFTLDEENAKWVQETQVKTMEELRQTHPEGRAFADTVRVILERDKNWVKWKNELCSPFDKEPWTTEIEGKNVGLEEATREARKKLREPPEDWQWSLGTQPLTEIWEMGYTGLRDLENPFEPGDVKDFVKKIKLEDHKIEMRKKTLARQQAAKEQARAQAAARAQALLAEPAPAPQPVEATPKPPDASSEPVLATPTPRPLTTVSSPLHPSLPAKPLSSSSPARPLAISSEPVRASTPVPAAPIPPVAVPIPTPAPTPAPPPASAPAPPPDEQILKLEENKQRWAWLALRTARDQHLQHFGKIGTGDIELLQQEIEREKQEPKEKLPKGEEEVRSVSPLVLRSSAPPTDESKPLESVGAKTDVEGDVKMEDR